MSDPLEHQQATGGAGTGDRDAQIATIAALVETLAKNLRRVEGKVNQLATKPADAANTEEDPARPAVWVWFSPPAAAENDPEGDEDPRFTVVNFVAWYNLTFVGIDGSRSRPIPPCWRQHSGLAMEVATLAYTWRAANIGPSANERDAQHWLHQSRPGFTDRLTRDWVRPDCLDGHHHDDEPAARADRFEMAEQLVDPAGRWANQGIGAG